MRDHRRSATIVIAGLLAVSLWGCGKRAAPVPTPVVRDSKSVVDSALEALKSGNDFQRREAIMTLVSPPVPDDRILPALENALKTEKTPALRKELANAIKRHRRKRR